MSPLPRSGLGKPAPKKSTAWPMFMIVGVAVAVPFMLLAMIVGGVLLVWYMAAQAGNQIADNLPDIEIPAKKAVRNKKPLEQNGPVAGALGQPAPPPAPAGRTVVDLVSLIDPHTDSVHGNWSVINGVLHCPDKHLVPRIQIPYQPSEEYDFVAVFSQPKLRNGIAMVMPNPNGGSFFFAVGSQRGGRYDLHGNPPIGGILTNAIRPNTHHAVTIEVRKKNVKVSVDGKQIINHGTDFRDLTCDDWRRLNDARFLGVACDDPTVFHHVRVVEISGPGKAQR